VRIELHPDAKAELRAAAGWYDELSEGAGDELLDEVDAALRRIAALPNACRPWPGVAERPIRQGVVHRFPYLIAFELQNDTLIVYAIAHRKRQPLYWYSRAT
jgi:toxin ParE1/3/4